MSAAVEDGSRSHDLPARASPQRLGRSYVIALLKRRGISPRKALGQNFLVDPSVAKKMCRIAEVSEADCVLEIGPGVGSLTTALVGCGAYVLAIEKDAALASVVRSTVPGALVVSADAFVADVIEAAKEALDVLQTEAGGHSWKTVLEAFEAARDWKLVSNLPYSRGTSLLLHLLETYPKVRSGAVMLQVEVAQRLCGSKDSRNSSAASLLLAYAAEASIAAKVPPDVFYPRPRVVSAIVQFQRREKPPVVAPKQLLFALVNQGFAFRRKMLKNALVGLEWFSDPHFATELFAKAGIDPTARAEQIGLEGFAALASAVREVDSEWQNSLPILKKKRWVP